MYLSNSALQVAVKRVGFVEEKWLSGTGIEPVAGPMLRKGEMKNATWIAAYEDRDVQIGLGCGRSGHAQFGRGM